MYYPKSQITTNLYTNGGEFTTRYNDPSSDYTGYYWRTSDNKFYTGKTPQDRPNQILFKYKVVDSYPQQLLESGSYYQVVNLNIDTNDDSQTEMLTYANLTKYNIDKKVFVPYYLPNVPTDKDYQIGEYRRYFCKKVNEVIYIEINKDMYDKLKAKDKGIAWQQYLYFNIPWQLTGDKEKVYTTNKNVVLLIIKNQKLFMFDKYLKEDYIKYYKYTA
jgi:hypothetical protein